MVFHWVCHRSLFFICVSLVCFEAFIECRLLNKMLMSKRLMNQVFVVIWNLSLRDCYQNCLSRSNCSSFNYHHVLHKCELNREEFGEHNPLFGQSGYTYSQKSDWNQTQAHPNCSSCPSGTACEDTSNTVSCLFKECARPNNPAGYEILGNTVSVGKTLKYRCVDGYTSSGNQTKITCQANGTWSLRDFICVTSGTVPTTTRLSTSTSTSTAGSACQEWVHTVIDVSSVWSVKLSGWNEVEVLGAPDEYPQYGDSPQAWCASDDDLTPWIEVQFATSMYVYRVDIYETYYSGCVSAVKAWTGTSYDSIWAGSRSSSAICESRIFSPPIQVTAYQTYRLRVELIRTHMEWPEIDAIEIRGLCN